jgi:hypothetical protein
MFVILFWFGVFVVLLIAFCLACGAWRVNMMVNHPEKYRQFREFELEFQHDIKKNAAEQAEVARKAGTVVAKGAAAIAGRFLKK